MESVQLHGTSANRDAPPCLRLSAYDAIAFSPPLGRHGPSVDDSSTATLEEKRALEARKSLLSAKQKQIAAKLGFGNSTSSDIREVSQKRDVEEGTSSVIKRPKKRPLIHQRSIEQARGSEEAQDASKGTGVIVIIRRRWRLPNVCYLRRRDPVLVIIFAIRPEHAEPFTCALRCLRNRT